MFSQVCTMEGGYVTDASNKNHMSNIKDTNKKLGIKVTDII